MLVEPLPLWCDELEAPCCRLPPLLCPICLDWFGCFECCFVADDFLCGIARSFCCRKMKGILRIDRGASVSAILVSSTATANRSSAQKPVGRHAALRITSRSCEENSKVAPSAAIHAERRHLGIAT